MKVHLLLALSFIAACNNKSAVGVPDGQSSTVSIKNNLPLTENTKAWATAEVSATSVSATNQTPIHFNFKSTDVKDSALSFSLIYGTYTFKINYFDENNQVLYTLCEDGKDKLVTIEIPEFTPNLLICGSERATSADSNSSTTTTPSVTPIPTETATPTPSPTPPPAPAPIPTPMPPPTPVTLPDSFLKINGNWWQCIDTPNGTAGKIGNSLSHGLQIILDKANLRYTYKVFTYAEAWCGIKSSQPVLNSEDARAIVGGELSGTTYILQTKKPSDADVHHLVNFSTVTDRAFKLVNECDRKDGATGSGTTCVTYNQNFDRIGN